MIGIGMIVLLMMFARRNYYRKIVDISKFDSESTLHGLAFSFYPLVEVLCNKYSTSLVIRKRVRYLRLWHAANELKVSTILHFSKMITLGIFSGGLVIIMLSSMEQIDPVMSVYSITFIGVVSIYPDYQLKQRYEKTIAEIQKELPIFLQQLSLLLKAGLTIQNSYAFAIKSSKEKHLGIVIALIERECEKGSELLLAFGIVADVVSTTAINRLVSLMTQARHTGVHNLSNQLLYLAEDIMKERQLFIRTISEKLSTKMLMPMMISMIGIMALLIFPIFQQF
jgi:tight adherence protein C